MPLFVAALAVAAGAAAQSGLPMAARTTDRAQVYATKQQQFTVRPDELPVELPEGTYVVAWEQDTKGGYYRITPDGFTPEAWLSGRDMEFQPGVELEPEPEYLARIKGVYEDRVDRNTVRYCGIVTEDVWEWRWFSPQGEVRTGRTPDGGLIKLPEKPHLTRGTLLPIYRVTDDLYEVRARRRASPDSENDSQWVERRFFETRAPFEGEGHPCLPEYRVFDLPKFTVVRADAIRQAPSDDSPPIAFFAVGDVLQASKRFPGGWYLGGPNGVEGWFKASSVQEYGTAVALPALPAGTSFPVAAVTTGNNLRVRVGPGSEYPVALTLDAGSVLVVYEQRDGWYRLTPLLGEYASPPDQDFPLPAWVATQYVSLRPGDPLDTSYFDAMRTNRLARKPDVGRPEAAPQPASGRGSGVPSCFSVFAWVVGGLGGAILLIALGWRFRAHLGALISAAWASLLILLYDLWRRRRLQRVEVAAKGALMGGKKPDDEQDGEQQPATRSAADMAALSPFSEKPSIIETALAGMAHRKKLSIVQRTRLAEIQAKTELSKALSDYGKSQEELEHYSRPELANQRRTTTHLEHQAQATEAELRLLEAQRKLEEARHLVEAAKRGAAPPNAGNRERDRRSAGQRIADEEEARQETAREAWRGFEEKKKEWERMRDAGVIDPEECKRRVENLHDRIKARLEAMDV